jgi:broad specificity phosphatase PhoE
MLILKISFLDVSEMELIFIRHGQGEHNLNVPDRLNIEHPHLTSKGRTQVSKVKSIFDFNESDVFIASPTVRTIETLSILTENLSFPRRYLSPLVGPRVFPLKIDSKTSKCDITLSVDRIEKEYSDFIVLEKTEKTIWAQGINVIDEDRFYGLGERMITWIKDQGIERAFIIAHDGTINSYRQLLGEQGLKRSDFLGEAGSYKINL